MTRYIQPTNIISKNILLVIAAIAIHFSSFSQDKQTNIKDLFLEAESNFLYEEYTEALPSYLKIYKADTSNYNVCYKAGVCYLNIPYEKTKSISFLEKASRNITNDYKANTLKEKKAPLDALFYLGNAYRINDQLDKALSVYHQFKRVLDPTIFDEQLVEEQIKAVERAKDYEKTPFFFVAKNLGETLNSRFSESNAVVSGDENTIVYNVKLQFYDALYYSTKENGQWSPPVNIIPELGVDGDVYASSLSFNGSELFLYRSDNFDGNLYVTRLVNNKWTPIKKLNGNINTKYWESHASLSADGLTLYFTSNREGTFGGLDIYTATRADIGQDNWTNIKNLGSDVNSPYNEETPFVSADGEILYFSSYGHYNMGGYDVFYSTLLSAGKWSIPLTMGYPFNTTDDDLFFCPVRNGELGYVCRYYPEVGNYGKTDIYAVEVYTKEHPRKFIIKGLLSLPNELKDLKDLRLIAKVFNKASRDTIQTFYIDPLKSKFDTNLAAGNYQLIIEGKGIDRSVEDFSISNNQKSNEVTINPKLNASKQNEKPQATVISPIAFETDFFKVSNGDKIDIKLKLEKGSKVSVNITVDNADAKTENFKTKRNPHIYQYAPLPGRNVLKFTATSPDGKISQGEVVIYYREPVDENNPELAKQMRNKAQDLSYTKFLLSEMASAGLLEELNNLDLAKENLMSIDELRDYLKQKAKNGKFTSAEVDSLFEKLLSFQPMAASLFIDAYKKLSDNSLQPYLDSLNNSNAKQNIPDAINYLILHCNPDSIANNELLETSAELADMSNAYYYYLALKKVASGKFKTALDDLDLKSNRIKTPEDLLNYLLNNSEKLGYSNDDVFKGFLTIPAFTTAPAELLTALKGLASGDMLNFLNTINLPDNNIKNTAELGILLFNLAKEEGIDLKELVKLYFKANANSQFELFKKEIGMLATGDILDILNDSAFNSIAYNSTEEFIRSLVEFAKNKNSQESLTRLLAYVASHNLVKAHRSEPAQFNQKKPVNITNIGIFAVSGILLIALGIWISRRKKKENAA
jgi:LPXTG-motif cell wall-anchored protein